MYSKVKLLILVFLFGFLSHVNINANEQSFDFINLPEKVTKKIHAFMKYFNLSFGHFDFIETDDDYIFLECNPQGVWAFYDRDGRISDSYADFLYNKYKVNNA